MPRWRLLQTVSLLSIVIAIGFCTSWPAYGADDDLSRAEQYLEAGRAAEAKALFEQVLASQPDSIEAQLGLGRAYFELGMPGEARIAFEMVLNIEGLPPDLLTTVEVLNDAARRYLETGDRLVRFGYAETGLGHYRTNSTRGSQRREQNSSFINAKLGGGLDYRLANGYSVDASLDYEFTAFEQDGVRNNSDLSWRVATSRALGDANVAVGLRGQNSYRGNGIFRNDYGLFGSYDYRLDEANQLSVSAQVRRRRYHSGPLEERSRSTATVNLGWAHVLSARAVSSVTAHGGRNFNTDRPDGESTIYGATIDLDYTISDNLGWYTFAWWEHDDYNTDALHFFPDEVDQDILRRNDNLYEVGTQLIWQFEKSWTLRPELLYIRDRSNTVLFNYSSIEVWVNLRRDF
jgi:tetratricopeptide (TPR) repeat protein